MMVRYRRLALSALFGVAIFLQKSFAPPPYDKMFSILLQITLLNLSFLLMGSLGAVSTAVIAGLLTSTIRGWVAPLTLTLSTLYGLLVALFNKLLRVVDEEGVRKWRLMISSLISSLSVGLIGTLFTLLLGILEFNSSLITLLITVGGIQGLIGGRLAAIIWERIGRMG